MPSTPSSVELFELPSGPDDPRWSEFIELTEFFNRNDSEALGLTIYDNDPIELFAYLAAPYERHIHHVVRANGRLIGAARCSWSVEQDARTTWIEGGVIPEMRNQGIGATLFARALESVAGSGRTVLQVGAVHRSGPGEQVSAATGFGTVQADDPGVRFLGKHGFKLEQLERVSTFALPYDAGRFASLYAEALAKAGDDYRVVIWLGPAPDAWVDDVARIRGRLHTDAPSGDLEVDDQPWDAARVRNAEEQDAQSSRTRLSAAIEHVPSGQLVALSNLFWMPDPARPISQGLTLVLKEHRGHRLGMLVKLANLEALAHHRPDATLVSTDNAEENRPMLDVNEAIGFVPVGYYGVWQKSLA